MYLLYFPWQGGSSGQKISMTKTIYADNIMESSSIITSQSSYNLFSRICDLFGTETHIEPG